MVQESPQHAVGLTPGALLIARESLDDPNFSNTIVLLCQHGSEGAYGLVLNRPAHMPLREIFEQLPADEAPATARRVYIGGPVQPGELQILKTGDEPVPESLEVVPGVYLGGKWETLEDILAPDPSELRLFLGYSGWGKGQLEGEVEAGSWEVVSADVRRLLGDPESEWASGPDQLRRYLASQD